MKAEAESVVDFPTLWVAADWVPQHCVVPDRLDADPFEPSHWQLWALVNAYRVRRSAEVGQLATAFEWRRSQIVMPQKAGKAPYTAARICVEAVGPALFAGWAEGGEVYDCRDYGCGCGWVYEYEPGEAMGGPWGVVGGSSVPLIQVTATSEEQTDNIYDALRPMIDRGPLSTLITRTGEEFIRLPRGGRIDVVTSKATSRLGQRVTYAPQDETGVWTERNGMVRVAETQRRGLAGMGGRAEETTNGWDPTEQSVAQRTAEADTGDIFRLHPLAPTSLSYVNKQERRKVHRHVYTGCPWVDLDAIEAEAAEILSVDPAQAERFFGNRIVAGQGHGYDVERWLELADPRVVVADRSLVTVGVDGARFDDALAVIATDVAQGHQWSLGIWEVPPNAPDDYEHPVGEVDGVMAEAFERWNVWRVYVDPQRIENLLDRWQGRWGEKRVMPWTTNRPRQMAHAVRRHVTAVAAGDLSHCGDSVFARHIGNAMRQAVNVKDDDDRRMFVLSKDRPYSPLKMDGAVAAVLSFEAAGDAVAAGALRRRSSGAYGF